MQSNKYDEMYDYLAPFGSMSVDDIAGYLSDLDQDKFNVFAERLAVLMEPDSFDSDSIFNYAVDSTLEGGAFPCAEFLCRGRNVYDLAKFSALYADKVLIHSPIEKAFDAGHEGLVNVEELAFGIYLTMRLESTVKAGHMGFFSDYISLCNDCLVGQIDLEREARDIVTKAWSDIAEDFCSATKCTLRCSSDGCLYVSIEGMDAYGSHDEVDIDFIRTPEIYSELYRACGETRLSKEQLINGGVIAFLTPLLSDCFTALANPYVYSASYLTTRPAQVSFLESASSILHSESRKVGDVSRISFLMPFVENATIDSILSFRARNEESFQVFRDTLSSQMPESFSDERSVQEVKRELIDPEFHKISLLMKNDKSRLLTVAGAEAAVCLASVALGHFDILPASSILPLMGGFSAGSLSAQVINHVNKLPARQNPMYFLWQIDRSNR